MKRLTLVVLFVALLFAGSVPSGVFAQDGTPTCQTVGGAFLINFVDESTGVAVLSGDLQGAVRGVILSSSAAADGTLSLQLQHAIVTADGGLIFTEDRATLTPVADTLFFMQQTQTITGGAGDYANASGTLTEFGAVDMGSGQGVLRYSGEICR